MWMPCWYDHMYTVVLTPNTSQIAYSLCVLETVLGMGPAGNRLRWGQAVLGVGYLNVTFIVRTKYSDFSGQSHYH